MKPQYSLTHHTSAIEELDYDELQARLVSRLGNLDNEFLSLEWKFRSERQEFVFNFSVIYQLLTNSTTFNAQVEETIIALKVYWLETTQGYKSLESYRASFNGLCLLVNFLVEHNTKVINKENIEHYIEYLLTHTYDKGKVLKTLNFKSYAIYRVCASLNDIKQSIIARSDFSLVHSSINAKCVTLAEKQVIETLSSGEMSLKDWKAGKSFNYLKLDYGKYYIEHCSSFFNKHYALARALYETSQDAGELVEKAGWPVKPDTKAYASLCLLNLSPEEIAKKRNINLAKTKTLKSIVEARFLAYFTKYHKHMSQLDRDNRVEFFAHLDIESLTESQVDKLNFICDQLIYGESQEKIKCWIDEIDNDYINFDKVIDSYSATIECIAVNKKQRQHKQELPDQDFYIGIGLEEPTGSKNGYIIQFYRKVLAAGFTDIASNLGWRESEFGFNFNAIKVEDNLDFIDQERFPNRYMVNWVVPKTHGDKLLNREITYSAFSKIRLMRDFLSSGNDLPCLYAVESSNKKPSASATPLQRAVQSMWVHFATHYEPFDIIEQIEILETLKKKAKDGECLSHNDFEKLKELEKKYIDEKWEHFDRDPMLKKAKARIRKELPVVAFHLMNNECKAKNNWVLRYKDRTLSPELMSVLDENFSEETKSFISQITEKPIATLTKQLSSELVSDCIYPTPHALRHMWAEAVYRRFDGDVGWMIRSQFKHISPSMWLAYIADKANGPINDKAKVDVINSVVKSFIEKKGQGYAGKLSSYLRRAFKKTKIVNLKSFEVELNQFIESEFVSIKANPWGFCLLKRRNQAKAKCAENGIPRREKAAPKYCLGCSNNLTQHTNIDYIYFTIMKDVALLNDCESIPKAFLKESFDLVYNAFKHIRSLDPMHKVLNILSPIIDRRASFV
ncbi:hypothetical protein [Pseudoalteromonas piratica]|uniref:Uncharacterized protein n=1 Tax=Pseudoalteromonas piratica TaxID=1348114 RepID=A0A0A7EJK1_9GAMM|nr:hypothetical protein [Pseudoalteromonas piratica]AIY66107.1 hypothetical protein OM33_14035 [Pseudoalteromonas piratica]